jgi:hypothetical protein
MKPCPAVILCAVISIHSSTLHAQTPPQTPQTIHLRGTITPVQKCGNPCEITFTLSGAATGIIVKADDSGAYQTDLSLGTYSMTLPRLIAEFAPPVFRMNTAGELQQTIKIYPAQVRDTLPVPAKDGTPFAIRVFAPDYWWGLTGDRGYKGDSRSGEMVLLQYNVYSIWAQHITYHKRGHKIEPSGNVVFRDASGKDQKFKHLLLDIADGDLTPVKSSI